MTIQDTKNLPARSQKLKKIYNKNIADQMIEASLIRYFGVGDTFQFKQRLNKTGCTALLAEELYEDNKMAGTMTSTSELTLRDVIDSF